MIPVANVTLYCELRFVQQRILVGFDFRDVLQFPVLQPAFSTLFKCATDMVLAADVSP